MNINLELVKYIDKQILLNLLEKYNYEFSQYDKTKIDNNGLFNYPEIDDYFNKDHHFAYFIKVDDALTGFVLINNHSDCNIDIDWSIVEFFITYPYRRQGIALKVVEMLFSKYKGIWNIRYHKNNVISHLLWNKVAKKHSNHYQTLIGKEPYFDGTPSMVLVFEVK